MRLPSCRPTGEQQLAVALQGGCGWRILRAGGHPNADDAAASERTVEHRRCVRLKHRGMQRDQRKKYCKYFLIAAVLNTFSKFDIIFPYQYAITAATRNVLSSGRLSTSIDANLRRSHAHFKCNKGTNPNQMI